MEHCKGVDLCKYILEDKNDLTEEQTKKVMRDLMSAMNYVHANKICHRDIKLENIIMNTETYEVKIIDFGLTYKFDKNQKQTKKVGSQYYLSPSIIIG